MKTNKPIFLRVQVKEKISERGFQSKKVCGEGVSTGSYCLSVGIRNSKKIQSVSSTLLDKGPHSTISDFKAV